MWGIADYQNRHRKLRSSSDMKQKDKWILWCLLKRDSWLLEAKASASQVRRIVLSCKSIENARDKRNVLTKMGLTFFRVELDSPRERIFAPKDIISSQSYEPREKRLSSVLSTWIWSTIKPAISDSPTGHTKSNCRNSLLCNSRFFAVIPIASFCITLKDLWS